MKNLFIALSLLPSLAMAYSGSDAALSAALAGGATAGLIAGTQRVFYEALVDRELKGWQDANTGTTTVLENQCGVNTEFHLVGDHGRNYLVIGVTNPLKDSVVVNQSQIEFGFNDTGTRYPGWTMQQSDYEVKSSWWYLTAIPFPSKDEFSKYDTLEAKIPVYLTGKKENCFISAKFTKKENILSEQISYSIFEYHFEGGPALSPAGPMKKLGKPDSIFGIGFNLFFLPNHGFGLSILSESGFDGGNNSKIHEKFTKGLNYDALSTTLSLNYVYRHYVAPNLSLNYEPGFGLQTISDQDGNNNNKREVSSAINFSQKLMLNWRFTTMTHHPTLLMGLNAGLGPVHIYVPRDSIGGTNTDGHRFGILARFGVGF